MNQTTSTSVQGKTYWDVFNNILASSSTMRMNQVESIDDLFNKLISDGEIYTVIKMAKSYKLSPELKNMTLPIAFLALIKIKDFIAAFEITKPIPDVYVRRPLVEMLFSHPDCDL